MQNSELKKQFGNINIYVFDQMLKGRITKEHSILDAGCGTGRNHYFFAKNGYKLSAFDKDENSLNTAILTARQLHYANLQNFKLGDMEAIPFPDRSFDWVMNIAVLHFAKNHEHFQQMLNELWRVCAPGGKIIIRLASNIGIKHLLIELGNGRFLLPDGSERFVVSEEEILSQTTRLGATLFEPLKTTNVQNLRCMTTWCLWK